MLCHNVFTTACIVAKKLISLNATVESLLVDEVRRYKHRWIDGFFLVVFHNLILLNTNKIKVCFDKDIIYIKTCLQWDDKSDE